jgi:hypothetical protein
VAVWHIMKEEVAHRHADERSVAASFINLAYKVPTKRRREKPSFHLFFFVFSSALNN